MNTDKITIQKWLAETGIVLSKSEMQQLAGVEDVQIGHKMTLVFENGQSLHMERKWNEAAQIFWYSANRYNRKGEWIESRQNYPIWDILEYIDNVAHED